MKRRIKWVNLLMLIIFIASSTVLLVGGLKIALSTICLTWTGSVLATGLVIIAGTSWNYLYEEAQ